MKLIKYLLLLSLIVIVSIFIFFDNFAKFAIEKYGSESIGVKISVEDINSSFIDKKIIINDLSVENPVGFTGDIFKLKNLDFQVKSFNDNLIIIEKLLINGVNINIIQNNKTFNLLVLKDNLQKNNGTNSANSTSKSKEKNTDNKDDIKLIVNNFELNDLNVNIDTKLIKKNLVLSDIKLTNFGGKDGFYLKDFSKVLLSFLMKKAEESIKNNKLNLKKKLNEKKEEIKQKLKHKLEEKKEKIKQKLNQKLKQEENKLKDKLKNVFKL